MRRLLLALCLLCCVAIVHAGDGRPNTYRVSIDDKAWRAHVVADIWQESDVLSMFNIMPADGLPNGQADLVADLRVTDGNGAPVALKNLGSGDYAVQGKRRLHMDYTVTLEHDKHAWPAGMEEVGYRTDEGVMLTGAALFFADGDVPFADPIRVTFALPAGWRAHTPWTAVDATSFDVASRRELTSNALFFGTADASTFEAGGVQLTLVLGKRYLPAKPRFEHLLRTQLQSYFELFGGPPRASRYLIVINEDASGDGGAFASSFSQFIQGDADARNEVIWGYVMAHELLHFWNGLTIVPTDWHEEWFKEGATDYLTIATLAKNGLIDQPLLFKRLENVPRRALIARHAQGLSMTVREAGKDKQPNRQLVYGGGSLAAMALDVELRKRSGDRVGLPDLLRKMRAESSEPGKTYALGDIVRIANETTGSDFAPFLAQAVESQGDFDIRPTFSALGLRMDSFVEEMYVSREPTAGQAERMRFDAIFVPGGR
ncbi:Peptidase M61 domain protein [Lysobacter dokdonensis DS-58]|uniref:Peptidase M61 domain protein n=1 Tax=Lysobacter dokdonensis DS-58 TaxID=1300345 RepID=A0A0A2X5F5_9GAMM|nr:M1 family aminopeptidase [Lysobacter dokdonensis]KGQ20489.1 Peptidase M61 domain protein [Lysobacter dokdonensis DS-58]